jgi:hypothetical protein
VRILRRIREQHFGHTGDVGRSRARIGATLSRDQHREVAAKFARSGNGIGGAGFKLFAVVFGDYQNCHLNDPRFIPKFRHQFRNVGNLDAGAA